MHVRTCPQYSSQIVTQVVAEDPDISFNAEIHYAVRVSFGGGGEIWLGNFFQKVIGCNGHRTENQHK